MATRLSPPTPATCNKIFNCSRSCKPRPLRAKAPTLCCIVTTDNATGRRKRLKANGLDFVVDDQGDTGAVPVILLHGFPSRANMWQMQVVCLYLFHCAISARRDDQRQHLCLRLQRLVDSVTHASLKPADPRLGAERLSCGCVGPSTVKVTLHKMCRLTTSKRRWSRTLQVTTLTTLCPHPEQNCRRLSGFSTLLVVHCETIA